MHNNILILKGKCFECYAVCILQVVLLQADLCFTWVEGI